MASCLIDFTQFFHDIFRRLFGGNSEVSTSSSHSIGVNRRYRDLRHLRSYAIDDSKTRVVDDAIALDADDDNSYWVFIADATCLTNVESIKSDYPSRKMHRTAIDLQLSLDAPEFTGSVLGYKFRNGLKNPSSINLALIRAPMRLTHAQVARRIRGDSAQGADLRKLLCFAEVSNESCCMHASSNDIKKLVQMFMSATCKFAGKFASDNHIPFIYRSQRGKELSATFSSIPTSHACLETDTYSQVTSPLRRWGDTINHFQLVAHITKSDLPYSKQDLEKEVELLNRSKGRRRRRRYDKTAKSEKLQNLNEREAVEVIAEHYTPLDA